MDPDLLSLSAASLLVAAGRPPRAPGAPLSPPVELSSTYVADGPFAYAREGNATWTAFEQTLGAVEGGTALVFASGMAAVAATLALAPPGALTLAPVEVYTGTSALLNRLADRGEARVQRVDLPDAAAALAALRQEPAPALVWIESPSNPTLRLTDIATLCEAAHAVGALVAVDNTFATPLGQQPLALGADVVVHSATKHLCGHSDVILGATVTAPTDRGRHAQQQLAAHRHSRGAIAGPMETWLALRGMRTLQLRLDRAGASASTLAQRLADRPGVRRVRYPGWGTIVAIEVGAADAAEATAAAVRLWTHATSLGGVESLIERRQRHPGEPASVPGDLLRLSVGIEDVEDLWNDLDQALRAAGVA